MNLEVIKPWITQRVTEMLGFEDDVVIEFIFNHLEEKVIIGNRKESLKSYCDVVFHLVFW